MSSCWSRNTYHHPQLRICNPYIWRAQPVTDMCAQNTTYALNFRYVLNYMCSMCHVPASATVFWHTVSIGVDFEFHCGSSSPFRHACDQATLECGR